MTLIIREPAGLRFAENLVLGAGLEIRDTVDGVPELLAGGGGSEVVLEPSGGNDTVAIQQALDAHSSVRLAPGLFTISATVTIPPGRRLRGTGGQRTDVKATHTGDAFTLAVGPEVLWFGTELTIVEDLILTGPGYLVGTGSGVSALQPDAGVSIDTRIRFRRLLVRDFGGAGVLIREAKHVELHDVTVVRTGGTGISLDGSGHDNSGLLCAGLVGTGTGGIAISNFAAVAVANAQSINSWGAGILVINCAGVHLAGVQCWFARGSGVHVQQCSGVAIDGANLIGCAGSLWVETSTGVSVSGLRSNRSSGHGVRISGGASVAVHGLVTDQSGIAGPVPAPHLLVDTGATEVVVTSLRKTNSAGGPPAFEADVAGAGGRVVVIQNNLDPARINSGGKFVQL